MKKNNFYIFYFLFVIFFFLINLYMDIKNADVAELVKLEFETGNEAFISISAFRISPTDYISPLIKDEKYKAFYSSKSEYLKEIKLTINKETLKKISSVRVVIGKNIFNFTNEDFIKKWKSENAGDAINFISPDFVSSKRSILPKLNLIINWPGDITVFALTFLTEFLFFALALIVLIIVRKNLDKKTGIGKTGKDSFYDKLNNYISSDKDGINYYQRFYWIASGLIIFFALIQRMILNPLPSREGTDGATSDPLSNGLTGNILRMLQGEAFPILCLYLGC